MQIRREKRDRNYIKKEGLSSRQPNLLLNLKSNTMKNTVQKYSIFSIPPNKMKKNDVIKHIFGFFVNCTCQKNG